MTSRPSPAAPILAAHVPLQEVTPLLTGTGIALIVICIGAFIVWLLRNYGGGWWVDRFRLLETNAGLNKEVERLVRVAEADLGHPAQTGWA